jgi:hypothetical protein
MVAAALVAIVAWRWSLVTSFAGPIGVDSGNWLRLGQAMLGRVDIQDVVVPPLVPLLAGSLDVLAGPLAAARLLPVAASIAPALGLWWVLRQVRRDVLSAAATIMVALVPPIASAFAWGGVPQLLGLGVLPVALWAIAQAAVMPSRRTWLWAGTATALLGATSTLVSVLLAAGGITLMAFAVLRAGRRALSGLSSALLPLAPVAALYAVILPRMSLPEGRTTAATGLHALEHGLGGPPDLWIGLLILLAATLLAASSVTSTTPELLALIGLVGVSAAGLLLGDVRFVAGIPSAIVAGTVLTVGTGAIATSVRTLTLGGLVLLASAGVGTQATQLGFYAQFAPTQILADGAHITERLQVTAMDVMWVTPGTAQTEGRTLVTLLGELAQATLAGGDDCDFSHGEKSIGEKEREQEN